MSKRCAVLNCPNARRREKNPIHFFRFPQIEIIMAKWIEATGRKNWTPTEYSSICEVHFRPEDYSNTNTRKRLRPDVVPTKCLFTNFISENECIKDTLKERKYTILNATGNNSPANQVLQAETGLWQGSATTIIAEAIKNDIQNFKAETEESSTTQIGKRTNLNVLKEIQEKVQKLEQETNKLKQDLQLLMTRNCNFKKYHYNKSINI